MLFTYIFTHNFNFADGTNINFNVKTLKEGDSHRSL